MTSRRLVKIMLICLSRYEYQSLFYQTSFGFKLWMNNYIDIQLYSEKAWACDLNGITQRGRLVDGYIITSA